ncbi:hypothetical protein PORY_000085 [Pneumocystis oryctolagi]|uniref:Uncharacterized protein n=1 Tax=Pneumocystis oryctolagi TaxID=42067 RepID=A0ACB7CG47_9ASCO|nr:hypothetical protein PORY_000085 [Pneumocystis oryctolagi]
MEAPLWDGTASLLLVQLILRYGDSDFSIIQNHLDQHPLLRRPVVPASDLEAQYEALLQQYELKREAISGPDVPSSAPIRKLCRILHETRIDELKKQIIEEEEKFAHLIEEINVIQSGRWPECQKLNSLTETEEGSNVSQETKNLVVENASDTPDMQILDENDSVNLVDTLEETSITLSDEILCEKAVETSSTSTPVLSVKIERKNRTETTELSTDTPEPSSIQNQHLACEKETKTITDKDSSFDGTRSWKKHGIKKNSRSLSKKEELSETWLSESQNNNVHKTSTETVALKRFQSMIMPLWMSLSQHKHGAVFMGPVSNKDAPGYSNLIYFPTDMKSIRNKIRDGKIKTSKQFHREILLLFANAIMYNGEDSTIAQWAREGFTYSEEMINMFMQTESTVDGTKESEEIPKLKRKKVM